MNNRIRNFIAGLQRFADDQVIMHARSFTFRQDFQENFKNGRPNSIEDPDVQQSIRDEFNIESDDIKTFINQNCLGYINYWTNQDVITREYGKNARAIMNNARYIV